MSQFLARFVLGFSLVLPAFALTACDEQSGETETGQATEESQPAEDAVNTGSTEEPAEEESTETAPAEEPAEEDASGEEGETSAPAPAE